MLLAFPAMIAAIVAWIFGTVWLQERIWPERRLSPAEQIRRERKIAAELPGIAVVIVGVLPFAFLAWHLIAWLLAGIAAIGP